MLRIVRSLSVFFVLLAAASAQAQNFVYSEEEGGMIDLNTGLVWVDVTNDVGSATYDFAVNNMPSHYTAWEIENGIPHDDWRLPSVAEFSGASDGLFEALGAGYIGHWASDPKFKYRGKWMAYQFNIVTGQTRTSSINGATYMILVRTMQP
jgi:hypothetical protein